MPVIHWIDAHGVWLLEHGAWLVAAMVAAIQFFVIGKKRGG